MWTLARRAARLNPSTIREHPQALRSQFAGHPFAQRAEAFAGGVLQRLTRGVAQLTRAGLGQLVRRPARC